MYEIDGFRPHSLTLLLTYHCNAACRICCFNCSPSRSLRMELPLAQDLVKQASYIKGLEKIIISGGEPFLDFTSLLQLTNVCSDLNLKTRILTNGYWGENINTAFQMIESLKDSGLNELSVSHSAFHAEYVHSDCVKNILLAAKRLKVDVAVSLLTTRDTLHSNRELSESFKSVNEKVETHLFPLLPSRKMEEGIEFISDKEINGRMYEHGCRSIIHAPMVAPSGEFIPCCGIGELPEKLFPLGLHMKEMSLKDAMEAANTNFLINWLALEGPFAVFKYLQAILHNSAAVDFVGPCHACRLITEIVSDNAVINEARRLKEEEIFKKKEILKQRSLLHPSQRSYVGLC